MKIAFFDSGIGGLSVLAEALRRFSEAEFLYFADEDHVPYGTKSRSQIVRLSLDAVGFLVSRGAEAIVVACNTATSAAISELRGAFSVPVIGMEPAVKLAADRYGSRPTLLIATPLTIAGEKLARLVGRLKCETWSLPLPRLVEFAQDLEFDSPAVRAYLQGELGKFDAEGRSASSEQGAKGGNESCVGKNNAGGRSEDGGKIYYPNGNSVEYFYSGRALDAARLGRIELFLARLEKMREID